ncbi:MAG: phosphonate C-P lyase system protein PhnG [Gammaproteobacteria bacterium]|nr:phosphonate C-P lyase system protein PhnG [Gammaproteobacteria bacterium]
MTASVAVNPSASTPPDTQLALRQHWMSVLARASACALEAYVDQLADRPQYTFLRPAEIGMAMIRGRMGGTGAPFNAGEMTMTRCVVVRPSGVRGFGYVAGRGRRHAELAAVLDALLQESVEPHLSTLIEPLHQQWLQRREQLARKADATRVNFMTMVRGD